MRGFLAAELRAEPQGNFSVSSEDGSAGERSHLEGRRRDGEEKENISLSSE